MVAAQMTSIEIGARLMVEAYLRQSEQRQRRMLETDAVGVLIFDSAGVLTGSNDAFSRMTDWSREVILSGRLDWRHRTPPEWIAEREAHMQRFAETGRIGPYEKEYFLADGCRSWMLFAGRYHGDGTMIRYVVDIASHKKAEQAARESEERHAFLLKVADAIRPLGGSTSGGQRRILLPLSSDSSRWCWCGRFPTGASDDATRISSFMIEPLTKRGCRL